MAHAYPHLFRPIRLGPRESRNRVMRVATTTNSGENGMPSERTIAIYRRVARGGAGAVVTESLRVHPSNAGRDGAMLLYAKEILPGFTRLAEAVRGEGAIFIAQLNHGGRQHHANEIPTLWAPSAVACPHSGGVPHAMTKDEVVSVIGGFATAAAHAKQAGCDGVEIHGAQGHLIQEFVSPMSNRREDEYGGDMQGRSRFAREIIAAVREAVGRDFIVGYRMGVSEFWPGGLTVEDAKALTRLLVTQGLIDYLSLAQGNFNTLDTHLPDSHYPAPTYVDLHAQVKTVAGTVPVIASSRIQTPEQAEAVLAGGKADMVGLCRALIADPEWPMKAQEGRPEDIRRCFSTSQCWGWTVGGKRFSCSVNPTTGWELELPPLERAPVARRVVVVGGGPAGLEAACTAAAQGHRVVLFEKEAELEGKLRGSGRFAPYHEVVFALEYLVRQARKAGIELRLGREADAAAVLAEKPDLVVVATGATIRTPELPGDGSVPVFAFGAEFPRDLPPGDVVVMDEDGHYWAAAVTEALAREGRKVTFVTRYLEPLRELPEVSRISTIRALDGLNVAFFDNRYIERAEKGGLVMRHFYNANRSERLEGVAALVWIGVQQANDGLPRELAALGPDKVRLVGDAYMPRRLSHALAEGHRAGRVTSDEKKPQR